MRFLAMTTIVVLFTADKRVYLHNYGVAFDNKM